MNSDVCVSVLCTAYNHEKYIRSTLEGFVSQQTNFRYEVIIHDDASLDGTASIIKEYEKRYPEIIKPIYQEVNQYSQDVSITRKFLLPLAKGRYIALCEGDDYWIDPLKLQKQFDYMESHSNCTFCFTNALIGNNVKQMKPRTMVPNLEGKRKWKQFRNREDFQFVEILELGFIPTASFFCRKKDYMIIPSLSKGSFQGDEYKKLFLTSLGYAHFINELTCFYNVNVDNSVTSLWISTKERKIEAYKGFVSMYQELDELTSHRYTQAIDKVILRYRLLIAFNQNDTKEIRSYKYWKIVNEYGYLFASKCYLKCFPFGNIIIQIALTLKKLLKR